MASRLFSHLFGIVLGGILSTACGGTSDSVEIPKDESNAPGTDANQGYDLPYYPTAQPCDGFGPTGFDGDGFCIAAPDPAEGFQLHYGPSGYDDPDEVAHWVILPGDELTDCMFSKTPNTGDVFVDTYHARLRPGSHHMITYTQPTARDDSTYPEDCAQDADFTFLVGATTPITDIGVDNANRAPEDAGLALKIPGRSQVAVQMHYVNVTNKPILKEGWINVIYTPPDHVRELVGPVTWLGGLAMAIPPKTTQIIEAGGASCTTADRDLRIVQLVGHAHANTTRISAFIKRAGDTNRTLLYETYDWQDPGYLKYNTIVENPAPDPKTGMLGGWSGPLVAHPGDELSWECEVHNDWDSITLTFSNQAYTGEMCNIFGVYGTAAQSEPWRCISF